LGAGAALAGAAVPHVHAAGDDVLKVALIGCGGRGTGAAAQCLAVPDRVKLVAVADAFQDRAENAAAQLTQLFPGKVTLPRERIFSGLDAYRQAIACPVDLVLLCEPPGFRPEHYRLAVQSGKHVFMEKPCCVDAPGFRSIMESNKLADQKGLKVVVGLNSRHNPAYLETVRRIRDGAVGAIQFLRVFGSGSGVWVRPRKPEQTEMEYQMRNWFYFVWLSGDFNVEGGVHYLDIANWVRGDVHPVEAIGTGGRQVRKGKDVGHIYDHHSVDYTYADGTKLFFHCRHIPNCWQGVEMVVYGSLGIADCCKGRIEGPKAWKYDGQKESGHLQEHFDLLRAIREGTPHNEGYYGATSSFTAVLGRMATYSGQLVRWDDAVAKGPDEMPKRLAWDAPPPVLPGPDGTYEHAVPMPGVYKAY
jgi:predicted dehydrogenase